MFLVILMIGYGLVEVPSGIWRAADIHSAVQSLEFRAGAVETSMIDAEDSVDEICENVSFFSSVFVGRVGPYQPVSS
jgi:hypothetical protein